MEEKEEDDKAVAGDGMVYHGVTPAVRSREEKRRNRRFTVILF